MNCCRRLRFIPVSIVVLCVACGCASRSLEEPLIYRDQRLVTTRPAANDDKEPKFIVRVERFDIPHGKLAAKNSMPTPSDLPPDAVASLAAESLASYGTPFYSTVERPRGRVEIGGKVSKPSDDGMLRVEIDFGEGGPGAVNSFSSNVVIRPGEPKVLSGTSEGAPPMWVRSVMVLRVTPYLGTK